MDNGTSSYSRFLEGDENGIVEIIRDYKDGLILYLNNFVDNIYTAEEIAEETFIQLVVKKPKFNKKSNFKTWLYTIGRNKAIDYLRRNSKIKVCPIDDYQYMLSDEHELEESYIQEERKRVVHNALKKLNPKYRQVLYLIYFEDFSNSQAATIMKMSHRQIENLIYRAKKSLKLTLEKEGFCYEKL